MDLTHVRLFIYALDKIHKNANAEFDQKNLVFKSNGQLLTGQFFKESMLEREILYKFNQQFVDYFSFVSNYEVDTAQELLESPESLFTKVQHFISILNESKVKTNNTVEDITYLESSLSFKFYIFDKGSNFEPVAVIAPKQN
jgi:hypothetical protein